MIPIGLTLQPDLEYLELLEPAFREDVEYLEVCPETCWRPTLERGLVENDYRARYLEIGSSTNAFFVAHGVGFSVGSARPDAARRAHWLDCMRRDAEQFRLRWYTDHLGVTEIAGQEVGLPLPLPRTEAASQRVRASLRAMQTVVGDVGVENSVFYFHLGTPVGEARWLRETLSEPGMHLVLDLHNVYTTALNAGFDPLAYVDDLPLERVIEVHLSGGSESEAGWLPSRRVLRLDSHDQAVPEAVWQLYERVLPRLSNVRGITLERMEGTVAPADVPHVRAELARARRIAELAHA